MIRLLARILSGIVAVAGTVVVMLSMGILRPTQIPAQLDPTRTVLEVLANLLAMFSSWVVGMLSPDAQAAIRGGAAAVTERFLLVPVAAVLVLAAVAVFKSLPRS